jgi:hypothetical protein
MNTTRHEYKDYQELYQLLVTDHPDAFANMEIVEEEELVHNALKYFDHATFPLIYPAKSYAVAIIYAYKIKEVYGVPVLTTLDDPDLFLGQDPYFVPYSADKATYTDIIAHLQDRPNFLNEGWAPQTVKYFYAECTAEGIEKLQEEFCK